MIDDSPPNWRQIVETHSRRVFQVSMRILGSVQDAEDVSQDVFEELFRLHNHGPVQSWVGLLVRLATVRSLDCLRRRKPTLSLMDDDAAVHASPHQALAAKELAGLLRQAVGKLPDQQATVFVLAYYEQMSHAEIATHLELSTESVSASLYKARKRLSELLTLVRFGE